VNSKLNIRWNVINKNLQSVASSEKFISNKTFYGSKTMELAFDQADLEEYDVDGAIENGPVNAIY
jgi:hypothetical protein